MSSGLKNLGLGKDPFYAARLRGKTDGKVIWPSDDEPDRKTETLVIVPDGKLQFAICRTDDEGAMFVDVELRVPTDEELRVEDLDGMLQTFAEIIPRHIAYAAKAKERYVGLRELSDKVLRLLGDEVE